MIWSGFEPTDEQAQIIAHPLAPLRVAAGAGTGKTTTIVARLAAAVAEGVEPEEAIGITFTNKAAEELADRLRGALAPLASEGREVEVTTYHGFALRLLAEFGASVGVERALDVIGPGYVRQLLHESLVTVPVHHLDLTAAARRVDEAAALGTQLAGNLLEPEALAAAAPGGDDEVWATRLDLARLLAGFREMKRHLGVVDYGDLILLAHRLVTTHPHLATRIRDRYRLVLLDEYQDTDPAQRELLRAIFVDGFPITAVGDTDQTIYEWRGASLENFAGFSRHFATADGQPAPTLPLTLNRRSGRRILGLANDVRDLLHSSPQPPLRPARPEGDELACGWFRTAWDEATWIAGEIRRLHDEEGVAWRDIGVLFRKNRYMALVRDALHQAEVPLEVASLGGLLTVPEVADVHAWLRVLGSPEDSAALMRILLGARYRLGLGDLVPLAAWVRRRTATNDPDAELGYPLLEAIDRLDEVADLTGVARQRLAGFRDTYRRLLATAQGTTLVELIRHIVDAIDGWAEVEAMPPAAGLSARLNLYRFLDLAEDWSPLGGRPSLQAFLGYLTLLQEDDAAQELDTARVGGQDAVSLLTVHRAKGLEWDVVFMPAVAQGIFPSTSRGFDDPVSGAKWLPYELRLDAAHLPRLDEDKKARQDVLRARHLAQERRTAYVAVTRARRLLVLTGAAWYETKKPRAPSELLELARSRPDVRVAAWVDDPGDAPGDRPVPAAVPDPHFPAGWRNALRTAIADPTWATTQTEDAAAMEQDRTQLRLLLEGMPEPLEAALPRHAATSVTGLVTLASCPQRFYWSEVERLPRRATPALRRGTEVHRRIELHHRGVSAFEDMELGGRTEPDESAATGADAFSSFQRSRFAAADPILVETPIDLAIAGTRIRGRIDAVFRPEPDTLEIVDYKSGGPSSDPNTLVQLQAYAVAAAEGALAGGAPGRLRVTFAYLGEDPVAEVSIEATDEWLADARDVIRALAEAARGDDFPATPSAACHRCDFSMFCAAGTAWLAADH